MALEKQGTNIILTFLSQLMYKAEKKIAEQILIFKLNWQKFGKLADLTTMTLKQATEKSYATLHFCFLWLSSISQKQNRFSID